MSKVLSLHGKTTQRRTPEEESAFNEVVESLRKAPHYVIIQTDHQNPTGPMIMNHNLHPAELNLLLDQIKLMNLDSLFYEED